MAPRDMVLVGRITGAHGIRGEVKLRSFTADPAAIASYSPLETATGARIELVKLREMSLIEASAHSGQSVGALKVNVHRAIARMRQMATDRGWT